MKTHSATFRIKVLAASVPPAPPFTGTSLTIRTTDTARQFGIYSAKLADGHAGVTLDWGDGTVETIGGDILQRTHDYAAAGTYVIRISDDIADVRYTGHYDPEYLFGKYRELPVAFHSNAAALTTVGPMALGGCLNLTSVDIRDAAVTGLAEGPFAHCTALAGEPHFPHVCQFIRSTRTQPFEGCTGGLTRLHFAAANEAAIKATTNYQSDPTLGTATATCVFDL